ncbi:MAG: hypothetical protein ACTSV1_08420 [Alphaproteobacteria bacterium]
MDKNTDTPYLSVVTTSRNDNHGGDAIRRMNAVFPTLIRQLEAHQIASELILVDWNPPADKPRLKDCLDWPDDTRHCELRVIEVSEDIHLSLPDGGKLPILANHARNAAMRRSHGEFILPTAMDILFPDALMQMLANRQLDEQRLYRMMRVDVDRAVLDIEGDAGRLAFCPDHVIARHEMEMTPLDPSIPPLFTNACGDFQLMAAKHWRHFRGYREDDVHMLHSDSLLEYAAHGQGILEAILDDMVIYHIDHDSGFAVRRDNEAVVKDSWPVYKDMCIKLAMKMKAYNFNGKDWGLGTVELPEFSRRGGDWVATES